MENSIGLGKTDQLNNIEPIETHNNNVGTTELILEETDNLSEEPEDTKPLGIGIEEETLPFLEALERPDELRLSATVEPTITFAKRCQIGRRARHEDACVAMATQTGGHFTTMPFGLFVVADGMGGHKNGHIASKTASRISASHILENIYFPMLKEGNGPPPPIQSVMLDAVASAHRALYDPDPEKDSGTTLSIALVFGKRVYISHVGDSRVYLHSQNKLTQITTDHSLVQRLQDVGTISEDDEEAMGSIGNILLRAVGQGEELEIDAYTRSLPAEGGKLILCTDGLWGSIPNAKIQEIVEQDCSLQKLADDLFEAAFEAGSSDNITVLLVEFNL